MTPKSWTLILVTALTAVSVAACGSAETSDVATVQPAPASAGSPATAAKSSSPAASTAGGYVDPAAFQADPAAFAGTDVVLFFHANWCAKCRKAEAALTSGPLPAGLTVVKADFDSETELRQKYGVTVQHTFVQIGPEGEPLAKWTGSYSAAGILDRTV